MNKIIVTNNAWSKLISIIKNSNNNSFMLSASSGGCNGFSYQFKMITNDKYKEALKENPVIEKNKGINVLIEPKNEYLLSGTTIDYLKQDLKNGIFESKFIFIPDKQLTYSCGCGTSFSYRYINE